VTFPRKQRAKTYKKCPSRAGRNPGKRTSRSVTLWA